MTAELEWIKLYRAALRETDPDKQPARVEEAKRAMKQALRMAVEYEDSDQRHAISDALSHLENIGRHPPSSPPKKLIASSSSMSCGRSTTATTSCLVQMASPVLVFWTISSRSLSAGFQSHQTSIRTL